MKENVFGIPMNVQPHAEFLQLAEQGEIRYYGVMRCADKPARYLPEQIRRRNTITACTRCGETCWIDPKAWMPGSTIVCLHCLPRNVEFNATQEVVDEVKLIARERDL